MLQLICCRQSVTVSGFSYMYHVAIAVGVVRACDTVPEERDPIGAP
jgi:hypothetical protein